MGHPTCAIYSSQYCDVDEKVTCHVMLLLPIYRGAKVGGQNKHKVNMPKSKRLISLKTTHAISKHWRTFSSKFHLVRLSHPGIWDISLQNPVRVHYLLNMYITVMSHERHVSTHRKLKSQINTLSFGRYSPNNGTVMRKACPYYYVIKISCYYHQHHHYHVMMNYEYISWII